MIELKMYISTYYNSYHIYRTKSIKLLFIQSSIVCCFLLLYNSINSNCQFQASTSPENLLQPPQFYSQPLPMSTSQAPLMRDQLDTGTAEARGDMSTSTNLINNNLNNNIKPSSASQANAIEQIVNFLANYAANSQQQGSTNNLNNNINNNNNNQHRRPLLQPTNSMQRNPIQSLQIPTNQVINSLQASGNGGFLNNNNDPLQINRQRFANNNNQQFSIINSQQLPQQQLNNNNNNNNNNQIFVSSSPATPYLTLNKLASFANNNNNQLSSSINNINNNNRPLYNQQANPIPVQNSRQPVSIPLGPPRRMQQSQRINNNNLNNQPTLQIKPLLISSTPTPPAIQISNINNNNNNQMKPASSGGFAPSGPPPSANNSPINIVFPSQSNAIVTTTTTTTSSSSPSSTSPPPPPQISTTLADLNRFENSSPVTEETSKMVTISSIGAPSSSEKSSGNANTISTISTETPTENNTIISNNNNNNSGSKETNSDSTTTTVSSGTNSNVNSSEQNSMQDSSWNPVLDINRTSSTIDIVGSAGGVEKTKLAPSLDIVTVPPGYNPDNPNNQQQNYDISVSAQMGGSGNQKPVQVLVSTPQSIVDSVPRNVSGSNRMPTLSIEPSISLAPTAVTTIIWSPPADDLIGQQQMISPTTTSSNSFRTLNTATTISNNNNNNKPPPTRIRDNSLLNNNDEASSTDKNDNLNEQSNTTTDNGIVYGKAKTRDSKPPPPKEFISPSPITGQANIETSVPNQGKPFIQPVQIDNQVRPYSSGARQQQQQQQSVMKSNNHQSSAPFKPSKQLNGNSMSPGMSIGSGFTITSGSGNQTMPAGDIQDYVANQPPLLIQSQTNNQQSSSSINDEPTISAHGGKDPASFEFSTQNNSSSHSSSSSSPPPSSSSSQETNQGSSSSSSASSSSTQSPPRIRRPTFKPKPAIPPIRIDSCIVGDDSSCDQSHNERCVTEYGISSCHCKPGFARLSQLRGYCNPISLFQLSMKIDKLSDDRKLAFNYTLENSNSEEYQYLEFESIQALASAFQQTNLSKQFMGIRVNKFFERKGKVWVNMSVSLELNNLTKSEKIQTLVTQELQKVILGQQQSNNNRQSSSPNSNLIKPLGDSTIVLDTSNTKETVSRLSDLNECASKDLNDCSKYATCINDFGGFQCQCLPGFEDKHLNSAQSANLPMEEKSKLLGRVCLGCSPSYCLNRGECSIVDGRKQCKCKPNFFGSRCDFDEDLWTVIGYGFIAATIIISIGIWYFFIFTRRWKRQQQKMDAMSATSGLTFNYVNSNSTNSLMSPSNGKFVNANTNGNGRSMQASADNRQQGLYHQQQVALGALASNYGQRFGAALVNGTRGNINIANYTGAISSIPADQRAIIGSTSSGSSAASQPIGSLFQSYEDAGLLIAPATNSNGSSEQTSPSSNCANGGFNNSTALHMLSGPGNGYTLSGHHHHHHHHAQQAAHHHHHHNLSKSNHHHHHHNQITTQFHPAANAVGVNQTDYRTMNGNIVHCQGGLGNLYDVRWRTLQQAEKPNSALYYLSPEMLINRQQELYASPQRELCIDTGGINIHNKSTKRQQANNGRMGYNLTNNEFQSVRSRSEQNRSGSMYIDPEYEHERRI